MNEESLKARMDTRGEEDPHGYVQLGEQMLIALEEVARDIGGEKFGKVVMKIAATDFPLPSAEALELLEMLRPGSAMEVMKQAAKVRDREMRRERKDLKRDLVRSTIRNFGLHK